MIPSREASGSDRTPDHPPEASVSDPAAKPAQATLPLPEDAPDDEQAELSMIANLREAFGLPTDERSALVPTIEPLSECKGRPDVLAPPVPALSRGARLGDFEIIDELGRGGMGVVYRARQISLGRTVALKVLPSHARQNPLAVQRFHTETLAASRLHHTNIVSIYAQGEDAGHLFYAMALVDGVSLDRALHDQPELLSSAGVGASGSSKRLAPPSHAAQAAAPHVSLDDSDALVHWNAADFRHLARRMAEVADALEYAHSRGVLHRDIKPHNLLVDSSGRMHVTDFGLARLTDAPHLTITGEIMGTPAYLAPEQVRGDIHEIDHRTDIYALGVTLYELITGRKPFAGSIRAQIMHNILSLEPAPPRKRNPRIPRDLETICLRAMDKERSGRHASAAALAEDLRRFADGRPILSRRVSAAERAAKWVRRHKAVSLAGTFAVLAVAVTISLFAVQTANRAREARELARNAYEQLAYFDYRAPGAATEPLAGAVERGTEAIELPLAEALVALGRNEAADAVELLRARAAREPDARRDPRFAYLLAAAERQQGDLMSAAASFAAAERLRAQADQRGAPEDALPPDAWFFRGLARHFDDPSDAAWSYRNANARRARLGGFYPQALLHLARARNQQLYTLRTLDGREEAAASLEQLVDAGYYRAYPYYLLSISNRLAGEIYEGSRGVRDETAARHFAAALEWAREGQLVDPSDDRPVAAEAECLERIGDLTSALAARTRQLELADSDPERCEAYHYRWRLYYWTGNYAAAADDLRSGLQCDPNNWAYAYVYPALLSAERGDLERGRELARALARLAPRDYQAVIWSATTLRLLGATGEADDLLAAAAPGIDPRPSEPDAPEGWPAALLDAVASGNTDVALSLIHETPRAWRLSGEVHFHVGIRALAQGRREDALSLLAAAYRSFDGERRYSYHARVLLRRSENSGDWPPWLAVSSVGQTDAVELAASLTSEEGVP